MNFLFDANVLSDIGNRNPWARRLEDKIALYGAHRCFLCAVSYAETLAGITRESGKISKAKAGELAVIYRSYEVLPFGRAEAEAASKFRVLRKGAQLPALDSMIAGHAKVAGLRLVTADDKDFGRMPGLDWVNWSTT